MSDSTERSTIDVAIWISLGAVFLYTVGWSYAHHFFGHFNFIGLTHLGIPSEYHLMDGFRVLKDYLLRFLVGGFVLTGLMILGWRSRMVWLRWVSLPLLIPAFMLAYSLGEISADHNFRQHSDANFNRYPWMRVWITLDTKSDPNLANLAKDLAKGHYRLLLQSETSLFLIKPRKGPRIPTVQVPLRQVKAMRRLPVNPGRE
uniref:Uncharacterized protein n=1 Tax=Candidatus Kentrum sp. FM TaxID=2126340 RepID=A0A450T260_9GAMM|nr:MAG: hypothetical protein BECKFM1743C_GA0114222_1011911 [Candidatus Kentron sp. FM]VFJ60599.1 MAG: hypothetical protein BECKFM1743A_GA0114220_1026711 [Candidatus Kentron sp. FM]VFK13014.1 MAG: hypothetical protein BECKFM1743B_GA0114221_1026311 [Candidatus Kentron sp. FM]